MRVIGNVQAENHRSVVVHQSSQVGGSVQFKQGGDAPVVSSQVTGDTQYGHNRSYLRANDSRVGGADFAGPAPAWDWGGAGLSPVYST